MISIPRIVIAGTHSGCGKTTVASGIMAALTARGHVVQPFKVGPDFIDPTHHTRICGRVSRNLDPFMMGEEGCRETFVRATAGADIAVIEGVMGMFDGIDGGDVASTAHVARILQAPVILVADVKGMSRSVHALTQGFASYDPSVKIAGIIYNRTGSPRHRDMIASSAALPSFGWIPRHDGIGLKSRHLGLVMAHEDSSLKAAGDVIEEHADVDRIVSSARSAPDMLPAPVQPDETNPFVTIGIAWDDAFCFYYQDNLDRLRAAGADLLFFSPLTDPLPPVSGLYFGGGYPELHLEQLSHSPLTASLKSAVDRGLPVYAECGGLMYLTREVESERTFRMTGILPADTMMTKKIQGLGYVKAEVVSGGSILPVSRILLGHEFHYSSVSPDSDAQFALRLSRGKGITDDRDGIFSCNAIGTYTHAYFSTPVAEDIVAAAVRYSHQ